MYLATRAFAAPLFLLLLSAPAFGQATRSFLDPPAKIATSQEIQDMYAAKEYRICVQQISRVLMLSGDAAKPYDRYSLLMLKGQCLLQLKDPNSARWAYEDALKIAPNPASAAVARANVALLQAAVGNVYRSRTNIRAEPISILEPESFQKAMQAFYDDEVAAAKNEIDRLAEAKTLPPIFRFGSQALLLHSLEMALTGKDDNTVALVTPLVERIYSLIQTELSGLELRVAAIENSANQAVVVNRTVGNRGGQIWWQDEAVRAGLQAQDRDWLRNNIKYLERIVETTTQLKAVAREKFGKSGQTWNPLIEQSQKTLQRAQIVLDRE
jgi:hypothetical protein